LKASVPPELLIAQLMLPRCDVPQDVHSRIVSYIWQKEWSPGPNIAVHPDAFRGCSAINRDLCF
jgi:hypothetical protein